MNSPRPDCLVIKADDGSVVMCSAQQMAAELSSAVDWADDHVLRSVSEAVLHFFREEERVCITLEEFARALEKGLKSVVQASPKECRIVSSDLNDLLAGTEESLEMDLCLRVRRKIEGLLEGRPDEVHFQGLRGCVKRVLGARRWTRRCQLLHDQIANYLRDCFQAHALSDCVLLVKS